MKLKSFFVGSSGDFSVFITSCGREAKEKELLWEEMLNQF
jgi:hypothetical protein